MDRELHSAQCIAAGWTTGWLNTWHDTVQKKSNIRGKWRKKKASKNLKNFNIKKRLQYLVTYLASILSLCAWIFCVEKITAVDGCAIEVLTVLVSRL